MDMTQVTYVLEIVQWGSLSKAAEHLYISQPALSQRIKKLEQELGYTLFFRTPQGVCLTAKGEQFCEMARPVACAWENLNQWVSQNTASPQRHLRIGIGPRVYSTGLFEEVVRFFDLHPNIEATFESEAGRNFFPALKNGSLDVVLDRLPPEELYNDYDGLAIYDLLSEKQCILMAWEDPRRQLKEISFPELEGSTMISALENSIEDKTLKALCAKHNIAFKRLYRADNIDTIMDLVRKGKGIVVGPQSFAAYYGVAAVTLLPETHVSLKLICLEKNTTPKDVVLLRQYLQAIYQDSRN
jgi:DNA-binding transcriptional LysR family regulator